MHVNEKENDKRTNKELHKNQIRQRDVKTLLYLNEMGTLHGRCLQIIKIMNTAKINNEIKKKKLIVNVESARN